MAGFLKKVFSFGRGEAGEPAADDEPLKPIDWQALEALKETLPGVPAAEEARPDAALRAEELDQPGTSETTPPPGNAAGADGSRDGSAGGLDPDGLPRAGAAVEAGAALPDEAAFRDAAASGPPPPPEAGTAAVTGRQTEMARPAETGAPSTWFQRLRRGLSRSSKELSDSITGVFTRRKLDEETLQELEDVLIRADLGVETALRITDALAAGRYGRDVSPAEVRAVMAAEIEKVLQPVARPLELDLTHKPHVILVVGVNGTGKTTTIGKLAAKLRSGGMSVMLAAGDTFRAAAIEQLQIWGQRTQSPVVSSKLGADAAGLAFDAFNAATESGVDVLIIDTAGRLQNKAELMAELEKIVRVLGKLDPEAPHTVLQTVDATTGQNALNQVEIFRNVAGVNGLVMTKLDGTARGGILVAIAARHKLPVYFIGVGEQVDDLEPFSAADFAGAIAGVA